MFQKAFKTIIVGVDFSDYSKLVVKQAQALCKIWNTKLVLVHAIHDPVVYNPTLYISFPNIIDDKSYAERIEKTYKISKKNVKIIAQRGTPASLLVEIAKKFSSPMIMVGHKGQNQLVEFFFGSTSQNLALNSEFPVWIQRGQKIIKPNKILIPHDLSKESSRAIDIVNNLNLKTPINYEVFHVKQKAFPVLDYQTYQSAEKHLANVRKTKIRNILKHYPHIHIETADGDVTRKIVKKTKDFDLLVLTHHNPTGLFNQGETAQLIKKVKTPIVVTH